MRVSLPPGLQNANLSTSSVFTAVTPLVIRLTVRLCRGFLCGTASHSLVVPTPSCAPGEWAPNRSAGPLCELSTTPLCSLPASTNTCPPCQPLTPSPDALHRTYDSITGREPLNSHTTAYIVYDNSALHHSNIGSATRRLRKPSPRIQTSSNYPSTRARRICHNPLMSARAAHHVILWQVQEQCGAYMQGESRACGTALGLERRKSAGG